MSRVLEVSKIVPKSMAWRFVSQNLNITDLNSLGCDWFICNDFIFVKFDKQVRAIALKSIPKTDLTPIGVIEYNRIKVDSEHIAELNADKEYQRAMELKRRDKPKKRKLVKYDKDLLDRHRAIENLRFEGVHKESLLNRQGTNFLIGMIGAIQSYVVHNKIDLDIMKQSVDYVYECMELNPDM